MMGVLNSSCVIAQFVSGILTGVVISADGNRSSALFIVSASCSLLATVAIFRLISNRISKTENGLNQPLIDSLDDIEHGISYA